MSLSQQQLSDILNISFLKADHEFESPPICLEIMGEYGNQIFATLGNFSTILARPKVGKTTFTAIAISTLLSGRRHLNFVPSLPKERKKILWIDTEQGKPECVKTIRLISKLLNGDEREHPTDLHFLSLRQYNTGQRIQITEFAISQIENLAFVVIDGIRDFVASINSETEATFVADKLLKWTQEKNIHILTILHQNKGDGNARGHLGTELMNKAETVAKLSRDENNGERITIVEPEFTRHKDFEKFSYSLSENGDLNISEKSEYQPQNPKANELTVFQIEELLRKTFIDNHPLTYAPLWTTFKKVLKSDMKIEFGDGKCKELVTFLKDKNYLNHDPNLKVYSANLPPK